MFSTARPGRGRSRERTGGSVDEVAGGEVGVTGRVGSTGVAGGGDDFLEGRPLFLPSEGFGVSLGVEVVFLSFGGLPLFFGNAS